MRWMVGVDVRDLSKGAVQWARWIAQRAPAEKFIGAHVVEYVPTGFTGGMDPQMQADAIREMADQALAPLRDDATFLEIGAIEASVAEDGLEKAALDKACDAFILGRRKPTTEDTVVRLGRVARRMLRHLHRAVAIVPPDLDQPSISDGPVLLATDFGPASRGAVRMAKHLADDLGLDLLVTHVAAVATELAVLLPARKWDEHLSAVERSAQEHMSAWLAEHGLADARHSIVTGSPTAKLLEVSQIAGASMIVVGSRKLQTLDRIFTSSIGTELAAAAKMPVVVVPPEWQAG